MHRLGEEKLNEVLLVREKTSFVSGNIKRDVNQIKSYYRMLGYYFVKIDANIIENDNNTVDLIYDVDLGKKTKISKIKFLGDKIYKDRKLHSVITSEESKFWKLISKNKYLNEERIRLDTRLLSNFYKKLDPTNGFNPGIGRTSKRKYWK